ncbi:MAG TPA: SPFH domain-containing protein [Microthrixaceae bacterium]|nr:SPFH domain-containing protein [Microthrixaceae bacterium]
MVTAVVILVLAGLLLVFLVSTIKIVRPYQRGVVERLGRYHGTVEPGMRIIYPFIDKLRYVDMREQVIDVPPQEVITADNVVVSVDAVVYYEPTDPQRLIYNVANFILAVTKLAQTNLRNLIGDLQLDQALTSRDSINMSLRSILDDATDTWGVRVKRVEIQRIDPPVDVMSAMHEQMKAERTRRATVTTAEGERQAQITRAEGERQAAILRAEAVREQQRLEAEGQATAIKELADAERYKQIAEADGEADAIRAIYNAIHEGNPTNDLLAIRYLDTLAKMSNGRATKIFLPADLSSGLSLLGSLGEMFRDSNLNPSGASDPGGPRQIPQGSVPPQH